jgi:hypothetical protein
MGLHNNGPNAVPSHSGSGVVELYYTASGGTARWPDQWTFIGKAPASLPANSYREVMIPWTNVPASPVHVCLLARWVSPQDPMTYPETVNTLENTQRNNNLAWRNVNIMNVPSGKQASSEFRVRNLYPSYTSVWLQLYVPDPKWSFLNYGSILIRLSPALWQGWLQGAAAQAGARGGSGFEVVGEGLLRIINPEGAWLQDIQLAPMADEAATLTFSYAGGKELAPFEVQLIQYERAPQSQEQPVEVGGVGYEIRPQVGASLAR